jgi:hypothetical protein
MKYKLSKKDFFSDTKMGLDMFTKGRMGMLPHNIQDRKALKETFDKIEAGRRERR